MRANHSADLLSLSVYAVSVCNGLRLPDVPVVPDVRRRGDVQLTRPPSYNSSASNALMSHLFIISNYLPKRDCFVFLSTCVNIGIISFIVPQKKKNINKNND